MLEKPIITLTTDFGLKDSFVGLMKGVIMGINPNATIIDITHNISRQNIFEAANVISLSYKYFPPTTIHVVVVDPGVGGLRRPILVVTEDYYFIGPDNGIFTPVFKKLQSHFFKVIHLSSSHYYLPMSGVTFHGRDIFAPIAAYLSKGTDHKKLGDQISDFSSIQIPSTDIKDGQSISGEIISIDYFGNAITNINREDLSKLAPLENSNKYKVSYNEYQLSLAAYYAESKSSELSAIINSFGHLELFVYKENAAEKHNIKIGDTIDVSLTN